MGDKAKFEKSTFSKRLYSMLNVDFRRMFGTRLFYIMAGICFVVPILILVMTTMNTATPEFSNNTIVNVTARTETAEVGMEFNSTWDIIGSVIGGESSEPVSNDDPAAAMGAGMSMTAMCNINLLYFGLAVLVCLFVTDDFKSGYAKNLFTVRAKKGDYAASKIIVCTIAGIILVLMFFIGAMLGGAIAGLPFEMDGFNAANIIMCILSKMLLVAVFAPMYVLASSAAKQKTWLAILLSLGIGMLLFMMIPMLTPLNATVMNVVLCAAGGAMFGFGLGSASDYLLTKRDIV